MSDWRSLPRKRVLVPGERSSKLAPSKQRLVELEAADKRRARENLRHQRRRLAKKALKVFDQAFATMVLHGLERAAAVEAAGSAPIALDREV